MDIKYRLKLKNYSDFTTDIDNEYQINGSNTKFNRLSGLDITPQERFDQVIKHRCELQKLEVTEDPAVNFDNLNAIANINLVVDKKDRLFVEIVLQPK